MLVMTGDGAYDDHQALAHSASVVDARGHRADGRLLSSNQAGARFLATVEVRCLAHARWRLGALDCAGDPAKACLLYTSRCV